MLEHEVRHIMNVVVCAEYFFFHVIFRNIVILYTPIYTILSQQLCSSFVPVYMCYNDSLQTCISEVNDWMTMNKLKLNLTNTEFFMIMWYCPKH